jgi:Na+-translocating membrane potential-generating system (MpsC)
MSDEQLSGGRLPAASSNLVVRHVADATGRGPTKARTTIRQDAILVVVQNRSTKGERVLANAGAAGQGGMRAPMPPRARVAEPARRAPAPGPGARR